MRPRSPDGARLAATGCIVDEHGQLSLDISQRWNRRRSTFIAPDARFDPRGFGIEAIGRRRAAAMIAEHHYLGTCPVAMEAYGLVAAKGELVGCAVFGMPASPNGVGRRTGFAEHQGIELTRFLLLDHIGFNAESWFLGRCLRDLRARRPALRAVIAHSDPNPRFDAGRGMSFAGHIGQIYQASNAIYTGRTAPRTAYVTDDGHILPDRLFSKARRGERGSGNAIDRLVALGLERPLPGETPRDWLDRALASPGLRRRSRPGLHAYVLPLDRGSRAALSGATAKPYPRRSPTEDRGEVAGRRDRHDEKEKESADNRISVGGG